VDDDATYGENTQPLPVVPDFDDDPDGRAAATKVRWLAAALALGVVVVGALVGAAVGFSGGQSAPESPQPILSAPPLPGSTAVSQIAPTPLSTDAPSETQPPPTVAPATVAPVTAPPTAQAPVSPTTMPATPSTTTATVPTSTTVAQQLSPASRE
jgi:hypothetical protein